MELGGVDVGVRVEPAVGKQNLLVKLIETTLNGKVASAFLIFGAVLNRPASETRVLSIVAVAVLSKLGFDCVVVPETADIGAVICLYFIVPILFLAACVG